MTKSAIYFKSLELKNVRCFGQRQILDLTDDSGRPAQWVLILGENNVGKTTLLECLAWMRPVPAGNGHGAEPALNREENETLNSLIRRGGDVEVDLKAQLAEGETLASQGSQKAGVPITTHLALLGRDGVLIDMLPHESRRNSTDSLSELAIFAYGATRLPGTEKQELEQLSDPLASLFDTSAKFLDVDYILQQLDYRAVKIGKKQDEARLERVKDILATVLPDLGSVEDIDVLAPQVFEHGSERGGVHFKTPSAESAVPLSALSLGYQTTITWIVDLFLRLYKHYPESHDPLSEPAIVLIDEIDLHLHPSWQRRILGYLTEFFPAIQFIATAHSPLIVQAARDAKLLVLRQSNGQVIIRDDHELVSTWRADQILASDLFGIPTRGEQIEQLREERNTLLSMANPSQSDEDRLRLLRKELDELATAEAAEDRSAMDLIREIANDLKESKSDGS